MTNCGFSQSYVMEPFVGEQRPVAVTVSLFVAMTSHKYMVLLQIVLKRFGHRGRSIFQRVWS